MHVHVGTPILNSFPILWSKGMESNHRQPSYKGGPITTWVPFDVSKVGRMRIFCPSPFVLRPQC